MSQSNYTEALKEAFASSPELAVLDTLEISHSLLPSGTLRVVNANQDYVLALEDASQETFVATAFNIELPSPTSEGLQELNISVDNTTGIVSQFFDQVKESREPVKVKYRPYLSNDLNTPGLNPPLILNFVDVRISKNRVSGRATFQDLINRKHPVELYSRDRFPSLGG